VRREAERRVRPVRAAMRPPSEPATQDTAP
jgi:hypothetical protein